jgi:hypothetical protein
MSLTLILGFAALLIGSVGLAIWLVTRPFPEIVMSEEEWEAIRPSDYCLWQDENPKDAWFMVRRVDGDYRLSFMSKGAARRFRQRWLQPVPNQAQMTHASRNGTGPDPR